MEEEKGTIQAVAVKFHHFQAVARCAAAFRFVGDTRSRKVRPIRDIPAVVEESVWVAPGARLARALRRSAQPGRPFSGGNGGVARISTDITGRLVGGTKSATPSLRHFGAQWRRHRGSADRPHGRRGTRRHDGWHSR